MQQQLRCELGVFGATMMGIGSIVGAGIFISVGIAAGVAGPRVLLAIAVAALLACLFLAFWVEVTIWLAGLAR